MRHSGVDFIKNDYIVKQNKSVTFTRWHKQNALQPATKYNTRIFYNSS